MSEQQGALTYERVLKMFRKTDRRIRAIAKQQKEMIAANDKRLEEEAKRREEEAKRREEEEAKRQERRAEEDRKTQEQMKQLRKDIGSLGGRIGDIIFEMVRANIDDKFENLGYNIASSWQKRPFRNHKLGIRGEVDLFLFGDVDILIEVKTKLEKADVREHIERLEKYRRYLDAGGAGPDRLPSDRYNSNRFIGAVTGAVVDEDAVAFAQENGMYVIVQSGDAFEILTPPEGFTAKEW